MNHIKKFTNTMVKSIKPAEKLSEFTEGNGHCLRISPKGKKSWVYSYKFDGKSKRFTIGCYPAIKVAEARKLMSDAALLKDRGIDPAQAKKDTEARVKAEQERENV